MAQLIRLEQANKPTTFNDQLSAATIATIEADADTYADVLNAIISQFKRIMVGDSAGDWTNDPTTVGASLSALNTAIAAISAATYTCAVGVAANNLVYLKSDGTVDVAEQGTPAKQPVLGFVVAKSNSVTCTVRYIGELTGFSSLTPGAPYYLGAAGAITATAPASSSTGSVSQQVGVAKSATVLDIRIWPPVFL